MHASDTTLKGIAVPIGALRRHGVGPDRHIAPTIARRHSVSADTAALTVNSYLIKLIFGGRARQRIADFYANEGMNGDDDHSR
jgi:hypothetical protein